MSDFPPVIPQLLHTVLDATDVRREAEFWRNLLGLAYRLLGLALGFPTYAIFHAQLPRLSPGPQLSQRRSG